MIWIVTRHKDTVRWVIALQQLPEEKVNVIPHLTDEHLEMIQRGDEVYGVLPLHLIQRVLMKGAEYYAVILPQIPEERRGKELSVEEIREYGGSLWEVETLQMREVF